MKKLHLITVLLLFLFQTMFSQTKEIKGDTAWYKRNIELQKTLDLKNLEQSTDEFNFRFSNYGQVIEISKDSSRYSGNITNFIYHTQKRNRNEAKTLTNKIALSSKQAEEVYNIIEKSKIIDLPTDEKIEIGNKDLMELHILLNIQIRKLIGSKTIGHQRHKILFRKQLLF
ncbi:hypothetical protein ASE21_12660 [Flavobacterium sp. Root901]|uniref:hypothetical protein n=1 Tax=Flavobacterium sp. Root901 TaxID=1736605 RepID=UPI000708CA3F|nr:hypothetical protein [Flavobacterium sp. Root901]KRD10541.1 hypothetical protein ASE21_12660 [Flavobacterium sp. Root901]